jgi:hypothetical protein
MNGNYEEIRQLSQQKISRYQQEAEAYRQFKNAALTETFLPELILHYIAGVITAVYRFITRSQPTGGVIEGNPASACSPV